MKERDWIFAVHSDFCPTVRSTFSEVKSQGAHFVAFRLSFCSLSIGATCIEARSRAFFSISLAHEIELIFLVGNNLMGLFLVEKSEGQ